MSGVEQFDRKQKRVGGRRCNPAAGKGSMRHTGRRCRYCGETLHECVCDALEEALESRFR
jgi:DTW domain-containing protein YfiP